MLYMHCVQTLLLTEGKLLDGLPNRVRLPVCPQHPIGTLDSDLLSGPISQVEPTTSVQLNYYS